MVRAIQMMTKTRYPPIPFGRGGMYPGPVAVYRRGGDTGEPSGAGMRGIHPSLLAFW